jgi:hypothetical protein
MISRIEEARRKLVGTVIMIARDLVWKLDESH